MQGLPQRNLHHSNSVKNGILQNACSTSQRMDADVEKSALTHTARLTNSQARSLKRMVTKVQWLYWRIHNNWVAYFKIWSRRSLHRFCGRASTYWSQSDVFNSLKPCNVTLTVETRIHRLEWFAQVILISAKPNAPKFEDRSQEETEWQERCAREAAWRLAKNIVKLKEKHKTTFFSPSENWCLSAPSTLKLEEREFVVDSGASMHMISKKDLNSAELETVTTPRSPTDGYITANDEVQTNEEATVLRQRVGKNSWQWKSLQDTPAVSSPGKLCDEHGYSYEWINGQEPHLIKKKKGIRIQCNTEKLRTNRGSWFINEFFLKLAHFNNHDIFNGEWSFQITLPQSCQVKVWRGKHGRDPVLFWIIRRVCWINHPKIPKPKKKENHEQVRGDPYYSDIPEWLQEFRENLVDDRVPERRDSHASSSHELSSERTRSADLGKHSVYTHFPKDRTCEICQRTKITRAPSRRRAEIFGDLITADHKVLSEGCDCRNNHGNAVVVQDLVTQWIQSYPCKTKLLRKHNGACRSSWSQIGSLKSFMLTIPWNLAKACEDLSWNHCTSTPHRSETNGIAERAVRGVKEGTSAVLLQSGSGWKMVGRIPWNVIPICETSQIYCLRWRLHTKDVLENLPKNQSFRLVHWLSLSLRKTSPRIHQFGKKVLPGLFLGYALYARGGIWEGDVLVADLQIDESNSLEEIRNWEHPPWYGDYPIRGESQRDFLGESEGVSTFTTSRLISGCRWSKNRFLFPCQETSYTAITFELRVKLYSSIEESFPIPLKYIDVSRTTHTNLDVMQESRIDDYWNIDGSRDLSDSWTGFTQFTQLSEVSPEGYMWSERRLTKRRATSRPDYLWPELWRGLGRNAKLREQQKWSTVKTKAR